MNRIQQFVDTSLPESALLEEVAAPSPLETHPAEAIFAPLHYEPGYAYPLIIWLHGPTADEEQLRVVMPYISMRNYVGIAPRGTALNYTARDLHGSRPGWSQTQEHIDLAEQRVDRALQVALRRFHIGRDRVFLAGCAAGGTMALRLALRNPQLLAGAISLGGPFPSGHAPLARLQEARALPLLLATARDSQYYPADEVCQHLRLLYSAGMMVSLRQYPCGDELNNQMLSDMNRWIMELIASPAPKVARPAESRTRGD
jgi:phospholipase/carboxylesterase